MATVSQERGVDVGGLPWFILLWHGILRDSLLTQSWSETHCVSAPSEEFIVLFAFLFLREKKPTKEMPELLLFMLKRSFTGHKTRTWTCQRINTVKGYVHYGASYLLRWLLFIIPEHVSGHQENKRKSRAKLSHNTWENVPQTKWPDNFIVLVKIYLVWSGSY